MRDRDVDRDREGDHDREGDLSSRYGLPPE
jgi:hypothetical protein